MEKQTKKGTNKQKHTKNKETNKKQLMEYYDLLFCDYITKKVNILLYKDESAKTFFFD